MKMIITITFFVGLYGWRSIRLFCVLTTIVIFIQKALNSLITDLLLGEQIFDMVAHRRIAILLINAGLHY